MFALQAQTPINQSSLQDFWSSHEGEKPEQVTAPWQRPGRNIIWATGQVSCDINLETFIQSCMTSYLYNTNAAIITLASGPVAHWKWHCGCDCCLGTDCMQAYSHTQWLEVRILPGPSIDFTSFELCMVGRLC